MLVNRYKGLKGRVLVDIDNARPYDRNILILGRSDEMIDFEGNSVLLKEGDYIYTYTESMEEGVFSYILAEGYVILSPYKDRLYKWCCKLEGKIEFLEEYEKRFFS